VEGRHKAGFIALVVCLLLVPGALQAESYVVRIPQTVAPVSVAPSISRLGDWEISASFDPVRCEIYCTFRRVGRTPLTILARPPAVAIEIWHTLPSLTETVMADPAGLYQPHFQCREFRVPPKIPFPEQWRRPPGLLLGRPAGLPHLSAEDAEHPRARRLCLTSAPDLAHLLAQIVLT
jgi:hypothetical protein